MTGDVLHVAGYCLESRRWGDPSGHRLPILLMHEGLGSVALWKRFPETLAEATGRQVVAWSRQGHGWSDPIPETRRPDYMHREAGLLPALHERLGMERAHWLGHSDGGSIALIGAAWYPSIAASLILEAPHVFVEDITVASIAGIGAAYAASDMGERMRRYHADPDHIFHKWNDIWIEPAFRHWNIEALLPAIDAPALLIQGQDDEYGSMEQLDRIAAVLPVTERIELECCGHSPHRDRESAVVAAVSAFLNDKD
jgi:pimeloyl-ACP methyl ester carboxylesterase